MRWLLVMVVVVGCARERTIDGPCPECTGVHPQGILDPTSDAFHGKELQRRGWAFALCQGCHGEDFAGGKAGKSCLGCHKQGPTACDTCHGTPPATGAHQKHIAAGVACGDCHHVPATWDEPGHILDADGNPEPATPVVTLGAAANRDVTPPRRTAPASYANGTCTNVYCHGGVLGDPAATDPAPAWTGGASASTCGACHGKPPANHAQSECVICHAQTIDANGNLSAQHIDGKIDFGAGCTGCHGSGSQPAPPNGLHGEQFTTELAVGAHRAHLEAPSRLRGPIACNECHLVPTAVGDPGHIDTPLPAEVFPAGAGTLARSNGATPSWDRTTATCSGVYCHGAGTQLSADPSPGVRAPSWTAPGQVYCGSCHGLPPQDQFHAANLRITDCVTCHPSVDGFGNIVLSGATSEHMNGVVDVH